MQSGVAISTLHSLPPQTFLKEAAAMVRGLLSISGSAFYLVDPQMRSNACALDQITLATDSAYVVDYASDDPLSPARFEEGGEKVVSTDTHVTPQDLARSTFWRDFMQPNDFGHIADMFFRQNGRIIAVMSLIRKRSEISFSSDEIELLRSIQPFIEFTLNQVFIAGRTSHRAMLSERFEFTPREVDVVEWLLAGANNKKIAKELRVSLPTVKTHLLHIYEKTKTHSRTELLAVVHSV